MPEEREGCISCHTLLAAPGTAAFCKLVAVLVSWQAAATLRMAVQLVVAQYQVHFDCDCILPHNGGLESMHITSVAWRQAG